MAADDFGQRFRAFYESCEPDEQEFLRELASLADDLWGELPEVEGFSRFQQEPFGDKRDSMGDMSQMQQLRMQNYMDRRAKADAAASNTMKKFSQLSSQIVGNLK